MIVQLAGHWTLNPRMKVQVFLAQIMKTETFFKQERIDERADMLNDEKRRSSVEH